MSWGIGGCACGVLFFPRGRSGKLMMGVMNGMLAEQGGRNDWFGGLLDSLVYLTATL